MTDSRISTTHVEVLVGGTPNARLSTTNVEALVGGTPDARLSATFAEALVGINPDVRLATTFVEVLTILSPTGIHVEYWNGTEHILIPVKRWDGAEWVDVESGFYWSGTDWEELPS